MKRIGAVDIGGTKIAVGIVRQDGVLLCRQETPTAAGRGFADAVQRIERMLQQAVGACGSIDGIGIACPGPLDPFSGVIGDVGTLPGWQGGCLAEMFATRFGVSVAVENDADAATLAEYAWGAARPQGTLIYVTVSTGIGGGIVQDGRLWRGVGGAHPELGHQLLDPSGPLCYCGLCGCWESLASGTAMSAWFNSAAPERSALDAAQICELARQGDALAMQAVQRVRRYLGLGLANLVTLFAPDVVCLGGGVMRSSDLFLPDAQATVRRCCTQVPAQEVEIALSTVGPEIGLLGAAQAWLLRNP